MGNTHRKALKSVLNWYVDHGVDETLDSESINRTIVPKITPVESASNTQATATKNLSGDVVKPSLLGKSDARLEAVKLANEAKTLEELRESISRFEGISIKKMATNLVFSDGRFDSTVMLIGEAPGADEDRQGKPFVGVSGQLLDKILGCIELSRAEQDLNKSVYISNILNWRPPGNRTPSPAEIEVSLPFIEKHIILAKPKLLILCGGVSAKALLGRGDSISRLRKTWHDYKPQTQELNYDGPAIPAIATYHPSYLLRTPIQKRAVWHDMLSLQQKRKELGLL